jgi:hypothetical protein
LILPFEVIPTPPIEPDENSCVVLKTPDDVFAPHVIPFVPTLQFPVPVTVVPDIAPEETNDPTLHAEPQVKTLQPIVCLTFIDLAIPTPPAVLIAPVCC